MISDEVRKRALEMQRRRVLTQGVNAPKLGRTLIDAVFLDKYNESFRIDDIVQDDRGMVFRPADLDGNTIEICIRHYKIEYYRVTHQMLDASLVVFVDVGDSDDDFVLCGYLPMKLVEECEVHWVTNAKNEKVSFSHHVYPESLLPFPDEYRFALEKDFCDVPQVWDHDTSCWKCVRCLWARPDRDERERVKHLGEV